MGQSDEFDGIEYDDEKCEANLYKHGVDFEDAGEIFYDIHTVKEDLRRDYGEPRFISLGAVDDVIFSVAWTPRDRKRRIISARLAKSKEKLQYERFERDS